MAKNTTVRDDRQETLPVRQEASDELGRRLMLDFQAGRESAFDQLVNEYQMIVFQFLCRTVRDRHRAEDLVQEVFLRVYRARTRYRPSASFKTWILTIATRLALNEVRGLRRRRRVLVEPGSSVGRTASAGLDTPDHRELEPGARAELAELSEILSRMIDELPPNQRAAVLLSRVEDLSYREIGDALGVSTMAVKSLLMRARETLRFGLARYGAGQPLRAGRET